MFEQRYSSIHTEVNLKNPFPGLRPFSIEENHLFFGRESHSEQVLYYLSENRFAAVTGASGSGKSSLIYCGVIPILYGGFIRKAGSNWNIITSRPGNSPIENLAVSLTAGFPGQGGASNKSIDKVLNHTILKRSSFGLVDVIRQRSTSQSNVLLIIDQFEELFRYKESRRDSTVINETEAYIKLIVNAVNQDESPIYVVLTMRSDFIGECSQFQELTRLINKSNFLIPQMTREDYKEAILGPLAVGGAVIDPQLLQHILNTIENKADQLPVLQHAMMRSWDYWARFSNPGTHIRMRDYEAAGKMENALSMHANEAFEELSDEGKQICKVMFKSLTLKGSDNKGIRHPTQIKSIADIAGTTSQKVIDVADKFRALGRSFITPGEDTMLDEDSVIDISHESLMRIWKNLKEWVEEEFSSVQMYIRLSEASALYQVGRTGLWRPPDLHLALNWRKTQKPTLSWAKRYNPAFEKVMVFLDASEKKFNQEEQNKVRLQRLALSRSRRFALMGIFFALLMVVVAFFIFGQNTRLKESKTLEEQQRLLAEQTALENIELRKLAEGRAGKAEVDALLSQLAADSAERARQRALLLQETSELERRLAIRVADSAQRARVEMQRAKSLAERTAEQAKVLQTEAERQKEQEQKQKMLSIAQSMAVRAIDGEDRELRGLLALQAYLFNRQYGGVDNHPDIYASLFAAMQTFNGESYNVFLGHEGSVGSVKFMPGGTAFFSSGGDGKICRWDLLSGSRVPRVLVNNNFSNRSLVISKDGRWLASATFSTGIQLFNLNNPASSPPMLHGHQGWVEAMAFTPDSRGLYTAGNDRKILLWSLPSGDNTPFATHTSRIRSIALSPDGKILAAGTDQGEVVIWDTGTRTARVVYSSAGNLINIVAFNNRGNLLAAGDKKGNIIVISTSTFNVLRNVSGHSARIVDLVFSPDDSQLASASFDSRVKIWSSRNFAMRPIEVRISENFIMSVAFSPDGKTLLSSHQIDKIFAWPTKTEYIADQICSKLRRNMTQREWETYVGFDVEYQKTCENK